ncbi:MAG: OmpA family protein [Paracoccaceae bacterium]
MTRTRSRRPAAVLARICLPLALAVAPIAAASAAPLGLPAEALETGRSFEPMGSGEVAVGPWFDGALQVIGAEGAVSQAAFRIGTDALTTMQIIDPLRSELQAQGYRVLFECETDRCGGFDFRYGLEVLPEPDMHVDLGDFRYLSAGREGPEGMEYVSLLASRSSNAGYLQLTSIDPSAPVEIPAAFSTKSPDPAIAGVAVPQAFPATAEAPPVPAPAATPIAPVGLAEAIGAEGKATLDDLRFASGSAELAAGRYASLDALAAFLAEDPARRVTLVGHTDATGELSANIALSKRRAQSVLDRLVSEYGVAPAQLDAQGAGYLSPRASNQTDEGRQENRRVEAMLASTR